MAPRAPMRPKTRFNAWYVVLAVAGVLLLQYLYVQSQEIEPIPYSRFEQLLNEGKIKSVAITDRQIVGDFKAPVHFVDYAVLPPGASIGRHRHGRDEELYLVLEGSGMLHLDGRDVRVGPGSVIVNRAGGVHGLRNDTEAPLRLFVIEVGLAASGAAAREATGNGALEHEADA